MINQNILHQMVSIVAFIVLNLCTSIGESIEMQSYIMFTFEKGGC